MGRVLVDVVIENLKDLLKVEMGYITPDDVRRISVSGALVDTGASILALPTNLIQQLGLQKAYSRPIRSAIGPSTAWIYDSVMLHVQNRECRVEVMEVPDGTPILIGQIALELLDFVIDMKQHALIGNPDHGGVQMLELY